MWCRVSDRVVSQCGAEFLIELFQCGAEFLIELFHSMMQSF